MIRVYKYGLLAPTQNGDLVHQQMRGAHRYQNTLVEIERGRRDAVRAATSRHGDVAVLEDAVAAAVAAEEAAASAIKGTRSAARARAEKSSQRSALVEARKVTREAKARLREYRASVRQDASLKAELDRINDLAGELQRGARALCGVYWGTYLLIEDAVQASRKAPLYDGAEPNDPRFTRWSGDGRVGVQIQRQSGDPPFGQAELFGQDTRVRIAPVDERAWTSHVRGERRRLSRTTLQLRVGSEGRAPVWASWPMIMHRPLPSGSVVKWVVVSVRRVGPRDEWTCEITVEIPEAGAGPDGGSVPPSGARAGCVAVHLGWLQTERGLRVATWMDSTGETGEVVIGSGGLDTVDVDGGRGGVLSGIRKADDLRSIRDKNLEVARNALVAWLRGHDMPEWMRALTVRRGAPIPSKVQALAYLSGWRSSARLASLATLWASRPFDGDEIEYWAIETWRYHDYHLWQWEANQRLSALRRRREVYRRIAADLATRYSTVLIDGVRLDGIARRPRTEEAGDAAAARSNRHAASASEFRNVLENAVASRGRKAVRIDSAGLSTTCPECGAQDAAHADVDAHMFVCTSCTFVRDVDKAALLNMLRRGVFADAVDGIIARGKQAAAALRTSA